MVLVFGELQRAARRHIDGGEIEDARYHGIQIHRDRIKIRHTGGRNVQRTFVSGRTTAKWGILRLN